MFGADVVRPVKMVTWFVDAETEQDGAVVGKGFVPLAVVG